MKKLVIYSFMIFLMATVGFAQSPESGKVAQVYSCPDCTLKSLPGAIFLGQIPGIAEYSPLRQLSVVNPVRNLLIIRSPEDLNITKVEIYDSQGRLRYTETTNGINIYISAELLKTGTYFVRIYMGNISDTKQIYKI